MSDLSQLAQLEEEKSSSFLAKAIFLLWILMFVFDALALMTYYGAQEQVRLLYMRSLLETQAQIFLIQAISGIIWFIVSLYIFYSALFIERREKYNVASAALFLISGIAELILSIEFISVRQQLLTMVQRFPIFSRNEIIDAIMDINTNLMPLVNISILIVNTSIGGAFILIGLSVMNFAKTVNQNVDMYLSLVSIPQAFTIVPRNQQLLAGPENPPSESNVIYSILMHMKSGANKMKNGGILYILSGIFDFISILAPGFATFAFILFIIGAYIIGSGRKMVEQARQALIQLMQQSQETKLGDEIEGDNNG